MPLLASEVIAEARKVYLNDPDGEQFPDAAMLPMLSKAYTELRNELEINSASEVIEVSAVIDVAAGASVLTLPSDFLSAIKLEEKADGSSDPFTEVELIEQEPGEDPGVDGIIYWIIRENDIKINTPLTARDVRLTYYKSLVDITGTSTAIPILSSKSFLAARSAELAARFLGNNMTLSQVIALDAAAALSVLIRTSVKKSQSFSVRRRRFRAGR